MTFYPVCNTETFQGVVRVLSESFRSHVCRQRDGGQVTRNELSFRRKEEARSSNSWEQSIDEHLPSMWREANGRSWETGPWTVYKRELVHKLATASSRKQACSVTRIVYFFLSNMESCALRTAALLAGFPSCTGAH